MDLLKSIWVGKSLIHLFCTRLRLFNLYG